MDKSFIIFVAIGIGALYLVTNFIGDIQSEDETYRNTGYNEKNKYNKYKTTDSIGRDVLDVTTVPASTQMDAWHASLLKEEFLALFPDFSSMQLFAEERVRGQVLKSKLKSTVKSVEDAYFSGGMDAEQAKRKLDSL